MSNNVKIDLPKLSLSSQDMSEIGDEIISKIKDRTSKGLDKDGKPFKPYSQMYLKIKKSKDVDLKMTGKMLNSIKSSPSGDNSVNIFISGVSYSEKVLDQRPILGLTDSEIKDLEKMILERIIK